jgi:hypothetical protein
MSKSTLPKDLAQSPLYLLAVLVSARHSKDRALERLTKRQLERLGVRVAFADDLPAAKGGCHDE